MIYLMKGGELREMDDSRVLSHLELSIDDYIDDKDTDCILEDGVTIQDLFLMIEKNIDCFVQRFSPVIIEYIDEIKYEESNKCPLKYLYFQWFCLEGDGYLRDGILTAPGFNSEYIEEIEERRKNGEELLNAYSISDFLLSEIKDAKIILDDTFKVYRIEDVSVDGEAHISPETPFLFSSKKRFSFFNLIYESIFTLCPEIEYEIDDLCDLYDEAEVNTEDTVQVDLPTRQSKSNNPKGVDLCRQLDDLEEMI